MSGLRLRLRWGQLLEADRETLPAILGVCRVLRIPVHWNEREGTLYIADGPREEAPPAMQNHVSPTVDVALHVPPRSEEETAVFILGPETIVASRHEPLQRPAAPKKRKKLKPKAQRTPTAPLPELKPAPEPVSEPAAVAPEPVSAAPIAAAPTAGRQRAITTSSLHTFHASRTVGPRQRQTTTLYIQAFNKSAPVLRQAKNHPR